MHTVCIVTLRRLQWLKLPPHNLTLLSNNMPTEATNKGMGSITCNIVKAALSFMLWCYAISPFSIPRILHRFIGNLVSIPWELEHKMEDAWNDVASHRSAKLHTTCNFEMPISIQCMSLDCWRKVEYPEETPEAQAEHSNFAH